MVAITNSINNTVGASNTGVTNTLTIRNPSNTASSQALLSINVGGSSAGDAFTTYTVAGTTNWSEGVDNSASDAFVIAASTALGTTNVMSVSVAGEVNFPLTPAFLATHTTTQTNVTGTGTVVTVNFTTEIFDQNSDYDGTNTFTAPVTGGYQFNTAIYITGASTATVGQVFYLTSNRTYTGCATSPYSPATRDQFMLSPSILADMDAADTCVVRCAVFGLVGDTADILGGAEYQFGGFLAC